MNTLRVARRIGRQLRKDPRFLLLALAVPLVLVTLLKYVSEALGLPPLAKAALSKYALPLAGFFVHFIAYVLCTLALVRERQQGTLARMFACGFRRREVVLGYVLGFSALATVQTGEVIAATVWLFELDMGGRAAAVLATMLLLAIASIALGLLVSSLARTEGQVFPFIPLIILPSLLLCGVIVDRAKLAWWLRGLGWLVPLTYAEDVLLGLVRDARPFSEVALPFVELAAYCAALLALASLTLRERD